MNTLGLAKLFVNHGEFLCGYPAQLPWDHFSVQVGNVSDAGGRNSWRRCGNTKLCEMVLIQIQIRPVLSGKTGSHLVLIGHCKCCALSN